MMAEAARFVVGGRSPAHLACGYGVRGGALRYTTLGLCSGARGCATLTPGCILAPIQGARCRDDRKPGVALR